MTSVTAKVIGAILGMSVFFAVGIGLAHADTPKGGMADVCKVRHCM